MKGLEGNTSGSPASVHRVGIILATVVVSAVVIFSLGVMVGKRVTDSVGTVEQPPPALPTETLVRPDPDSSAKGAGAEAGGEQEEKLTFFDTLSSEKAPPPALPREPEPAPAAPAKKEAPSSPEPKAGETVANAEEPKPAPKAPPKTAVTSPPEQVKSLLGPGRYWVQVSSTTNRQWANDLVRKLGKKGIPTESVPVTIKGKQWYRIRVGSFPDGSSAEKAQGVLKKGMSLDGMVVTVD